MCALLFLLAATTEYTVRLPVLNSTLVLHASQRTAGAIDSLKFRNKEFVAREWQTAVSYDGFGDCLNPTEAGSSSQLLDARVQNSTLATTVRMGYRLAPDEAYKAACGQHKDIHTAQNKVELSDDTLLKRVTVGYRDIPNVLDYLITFNVGEPHQSAVIEAVTGYMPPEFSLWLTFDPATFQVAPLSGGPGEQPLPVILSTKDRQYAVGVYSPAPNAGYGRSMKWSCVFRPSGAIKPGPLTYHCFIAIGTVEEIRAALANLIKG